MGLVALGSGVVCSAALAVGLGFIGSVGVTIGSLFDLVGIAAGMILVGSIDSA
jgi:hypothetical protein